MAIRTQRELASRTPEDVIAFADSLWPCKADPDYHTESMRHWESCSGCGRVRKGVVIELLDKILIGGVAGDNMAIIGPALYVSIEGPLLVVDPLEGEPRPIRAEDIGVVQGYDTL